MKVVVDTLWVMWTMLWSRIPFLFVLVWPVLMGCFLSVLEFALAIRSSLVAVSLAQKVLTTIWESGVCPCSFLPCCVGVQKLHGCAGREIITGTWQNSRQEVKEKKLLISPSKLMRYAWSSCTYANVCVLYGFLQRKINVRDIRHFAISSVSHP